MVIRFGASAESGKPGIQSLNRLRVRCASGWLLLATLSAAIGVHTSSAQTYTVATYAGGWAGGPGAAAATPLLQPGSVAVDSSGNLLVSDSAGHRVWRVSRAGVSVPFAGVGAPGFGGDGSAASAARLLYPVGLVVDSSGSLYIADTWNHRVRRIAANGAMTTVAGNGVPAFSGDGGPAVAASLSAPTGVGIDGQGNLFIADSANHRIRKVAPDGRISTVAGNGAAGFSGDGEAATAAALNTPFALSAGSSGALYIADMGNHRVRKVTPDGKIATVAGNGSPGFSGDGGPALTASLSEPSGVAADTAGNLYIADSANHRIRKVTPDGRIDTLAGNGISGFRGDGGPARSASLALPSDVSLDRSGNLYIADLSNRRIRRVTPDGVIDTVVGGASAFPRSGNIPVRASFYFPFGLAADGTGNVYVADTSNHCVRRIAPSGEFSTVAGTGAAGFSGDGGPAGAAALSGPDSVAVDAAGRLFISDSLNHRVRVVTSDGKIQTLAGNGTPGFSGDGGPARDASLANPSGVALDKAGNLYIADKANHRIRRVTPGGVIETVVGNGSTEFTGDGIQGTAASLAWPYQIAVTASGDLYIADGGHHRIRKLSASTGLISTVAGNGVKGYSGDGGRATEALLAWPAGVAVDEAGSLYIADNNNNRIRKVGLDGVIHTIAGDGNAGLSGDGGPAHLAQMAWPAGLALDGGGRVFVADYFSNRVRVLIPEVPGACAFSAQPESQNIPPRGGTAEILIDTGPTCGWGAASHSLPWLTLSSGAAGIGPGRIRVAADPNTDPASRVGTLAIMGATVRVYQGGALLDPPAVSAGGVVSAASFAALAAPGSWVSIFGKNLTNIPGEGRAWRETEILDGILPVVLDGVTVQFDGKPAAIAFVSPEQLNVQVPDGVGPGSVSVEVTTPAGAFRSTAEIRDLAPALFTYGIGGARYVAAVHQDGAPVGMPGDLPGARPARPGEIIQVYGTGFGRTDPPRPSGRLAEPAPLAYEYAVRIGDRLASARWGGIVGPGLYQFNVQIPDMAAGVPLLVIAAGGMETQAGVKIAVQP